MEDDSTTHTHTHTHTGDEIYLIREWFVSECGRHRNQKFIIGLDLLSDVFGPIQIKLIFILISPLKLQNSSNSLWLYVAKSIGSLKRLN